MIQREMLINFDVDALVSSCTAGRAKQKQREQRHITVKPQSVLLSTFWRVYIWKRSSVSTIRYRGTSMFIRELL